MKVQSTTYMLVFYIYTITLNNMSYTKDPLIHEIKGKQRKMLIIIRKTI